MYRLIWKLLVYSCTPCLAQIFSRTILAFAHSIKSHENKRWLLEISTLLHQHAHAHKHTCTGTYTYLKFSSRWCSHPPEGPSSHGNGDRCWDEQLKRTFISTTSWGCSTLAALINDFSALSMPTSRHHLFGNV